MTNVHKATEQITIEVRGSVEKRTVRLSINNPFSARPMEAFKGRMGGRMGHEIINSAQLCHTLHWKRVDKHSSSMLSSHKIIVSLFQPW